MEGGPERLKFLGACGMFGESFRVISARKKLFAQITLALILPLCVFFLAHSKVTQLVLENNIKTNDHGQLINYDEKNGEYEALSHKKYGWAIILAIKFVYFTIVLILSLFATSAVIYTVACVYNSIDVPFKKVMRVVPRAWMRLIVTFLWLFLLIVVYNLIFVALFCLCFLFGHVVATVLAVILVIAYFVGIVYLTIVGELAFVVSVLEHVYGRKAMSKSKALLRGKLWSVFFFLLLLGLCFGLVQFGFEFTVAVGVVIKSVALRIVAGVIFWFVLALGTLIGLVALTVIYFVCKSYHHENLDMSIVTDHLQVYSKARDVQLERSQV
ncbi:uncharacterized protein LOC116210950 [Punica granatum]|uniref:Uncharacterized protein LOC116210950 n=2 Tax=Punica granatum TaxID=22663 RepID=A0A218WVW1_PUNGR|nr:uncharacterized protein LOC116210950 [Punica granatum]OWM76371.1 hypothetical protein CDL15_Pgr028241 [Punica granatum]